MQGEENIDLYNSFNVSPQPSPSSSSDFPINKKTPEHHIGFEKKILNENRITPIKSSDDECSFSLESSPRNCSTMTSQDLSGLLPDQEIFDSPEKSFISNTYSFYELSFERKGLSEEKVAEYKVLLSNINDAFVNWKINEFVLDTIKTKSTSWAQQIQAITKAFEIEHSRFLKSKDGEITNLLGLDEEDIKLYTNRSSAFFSKSAFIAHAVELVRAHVTKLKLQKQSLQDKFGAHSMKTMVGVMSGERKEQMELYKCLDDQYNQTSHLLSSIHSMVQQLATLRHNSSQNLLTAKFKSLHNKALYLHTAISIAMEKLDEISYSDENMKKIDTDGDNLKTQMTEKSQELKALQKTLAEYEKKEATSEKYRNIVVNCGKLRKQLQHKQQTLSMLNDPNMSL